MKTYENFMNESYGAATDAGKFKDMLSFVQRLGKSFDPQPAFNTLKKAPAFRTPKKSGTIRGGAFVLPKKGDKSGLM